MRYYQNGESKDWTRIKVICYPVDRSYKKLRMTAGNKVHSA